MFQLDDNDVVISGVAAAFPKADNVEEFAEKLFSKENLLSKVPHMPVNLGKLNDLSKFDAEFFNFHQPHRVNVMEPMSRIILEKSYEALLDSGNNPVTLKGKDCGVFIGLHFMETEALIYDKIQKGASLAVSRSFVPNRISYWLGIHGPSYSVDSACSSTLVALERGYKAILDGVCESALVGGCNVCLHPALLLHLIKVGALSSRSESRVFDENASGFCKAECIGIFYLQRAKDAKRVYARIVNTGVNHDGFKPQFLSPCGPLQMKLIKKVYEEAKIDINSIAWIEAHATGTQVGDKQEVTALDGIFANRKNALLIGSVKSNMGHAEAAAGVGSISKVIIAMETGFIPPNINLTTLRKDIDAFKNGRIKVITEKTPWNGGIVGVSGFGLGGVNCHVVLKSFGKEKINHGIPEDDLPRIVGVSGRTAEAVDVILHQLEMTSLDAEFISLLHEIYNYNVPLHPYRGYAILHKNEHCIFKKVEQFVDHASTVVFVFTNYLNKWSNIYRSLIDISTFQSTIFKCNVILNKFDVNVTDILDDCSARSTLFNGYISAIVIQIALYDLMLSLNIVPDYVVGYSLGELVCAYADGVLNFENVVEAAYHCAAYLSNLYKNTEQSVTIVAEKDHVALKAIIPHNISLAFPSIVSGPVDDIRQFVNKNCLTYSNMLNTHFRKPSIANANELEILLKQMIQSKNKSEKWLTISSLAENHEINARYFLERILSAENMESLSDSVPKDAVVVELLSITHGDIVEDCLKGKFVHVSLADENRTLNVDDFLSALGELYLSGKNPHFNRIYPPVSYPVSRGTKMIAPLVKWKHTSRWPVAFSSMQERMLSGERTVSVCLDEKQDAYIAGHEIDSTVLYPGTGFLVLAWETLALIHGKLYPDLQVVFEGVRFLNAVVVPRNEPVLFNIMVHKGSGIFEIMENNKVVATGRVYVPSNIQNHRIVTTQPSDDSTILDKMDFYRYILIKSCNYKDSFRSIQQINSQGTRSRVSWCQNWVTYLDGLLQMSILHDTRDGTQIPVEIEKIIIDPIKHQELAGSNNLTEFDAIFDKELNVIESGRVQIKGVVLRSIPSKTNPKIPLLQKYVFSPYVKEQKMSTKQATYLFAHVIMDYLGQHKSNVKIAEILDDDSNNFSPLVSFSFSNFVKEQPVFQADFKIYVNTRVELKKNEVDVPIINGKLPLSDPVHVIACTNALKNEKKLKHVMDSLYDDGFLITWEDSKTGFSVPSTLNMISCVNVLPNGSQFTLLTKKSKSNFTYKSVKVSTYTFDWIVELQEALQNTSYERIILIGEQEPFNGLLGFYQCLRYEKNTEHVRCFLNLDNAKSFSTEDNFYKLQLEKDLAINVYKDGEWGCYIRQPVDTLAPTKVHHAFVNMKSLGTKQLLQWSEGKLQPSSPSFMENLLHVYYAAVNSTDLLIFKKRLAVEAVVNDPLKKDYVFGMEFSGRDTAGKRYMGLRTYGCLSSYVKLEADDVFINEVPNNWSLEDAVTVPLAYYTIIYSFIICGKLKNKESVLIHSAGSVIGQAAINLAVYYCCNIFVTVSSIDEKLFVKENFPYLLDSRIINTTDSSFERVINQDTNGRGVDIILNLLPDDKAASNADCLAKNGRFIQIKRADLRNSSLNVNKFLSKNISLYSATLDDIFNLTQDMKVEMKETLDKYVKNSAIKPLSRITYFYTGIESAFEYALCPRNFGKCVIQIEPEEEELNAKPSIKVKKAYPRFLCDPHKSYVVCGGLGGIGMELVNWLAIRGAKIIFIASRRGVTNGSQTLRINRWKSYGVRVVLSQTDISDEAQTEKLLDEANAAGEIGGIFNLAAVLKDKTFKNQNADNFSASAGPKFRGTYNLDKISRAKFLNLQHFVMFSSISSGYGNIGQTNYGMFNSAVERICEKRQEDQLPAVAIEWGPVGDVGMAVTLMDGNADQLPGGVIMQPIKSCMDVLDQFLCQKNTIVSTVIVAEKKLKNLPK